VQAQSRQLTPLQEKSVISQLQDRTAQIKYLTPKIPWNETSMTTQRPPGMPPALPFRVAHAEFPNRAAAGTAKVHASSGTRNKKIHEHPTT